MVLARLGSDPAGHGLVHADLNLGNVLDHHGQARPLDFDDASWGLYALDLAIAVESVPVSLRPVLLGGYRAVRQLSPGYEEHEAALLAARRLYLATWLLANGLPARRPSGSAESLHQKATRLKATRHASADTPSQSDLDRFRYHELAGFPT
jgi:Ser/Thr protein kinase RdoA (MazF antagonist)